MMNLNWRHEARRHSTAGETPRGGREMRQECFDMEAACAALCGLCPAPPRSARLLNVWSTPPHRLLLIYELQIASGDSSIITVQVDDGAMPESAAGTAVPAWRARAWRVPDDPAGLPLELLMDPAYSAAHLGTITSAVLPPVTGPACRATMLSYLPGKRVALRLPNPVGPGSVVLKHQQGTARAHAAITALWAHPQRRFAMAQPLAVDAAGEVRWERFITGVRIETLAADQGWERTLRNFLPSLVALHQTSSQGLPVQKRADVLARLQGKVTRRVADALPQHLDALRRLSEQLASWSFRPSDAHATLHGDLHTGNLLATSATTFAFIDLDSLTLGEPGCDIALLGSRLLLLGLLGQADAGQVQRAAASLGHWYEQAGGAPGTARAYAWHLAALLPARQLKTCIRHAAPRLTALAPPLLTMAGRIVDAKAVPDDLLTRHPETLGAVA